MDDALFHGNIVNSRRILYTPSAFARSNLLHLQEIGSLTAQRPHVSRRENLASCLFLGALASSIAKYTSSITNGLIGTAIVGIVIGILFKQLGLLAKEPLAKAGVLSFFMMAMMINMRVSFAKITPMGLVERLWPIAFCIIIGAIGVLLFAIPMGKKLGISSGLIMAITMGSYAGYPLNYQVCMEVITLLAQSPEEE